MQLLNNTTITGTLEVSGAVVFGSTLDVGAAASGPTHAIRKGEFDTALALKANLASPAFTGTPAAPTASPGTSTTQLATTAFAQAAISSKADLVGGVVPLSQLPDTILGQVEFQSVWDASSNAPVIPAAASGNKGWYYVVNVAGSTDLDGIIDWQVGDWAISDGAVWRKVDNTDQVSSVNGETGAVTINQASVGLDQVDNTSDSTKNSAAAELTNKEISGVNNTLSVRLESDVTGTLPLANMTFGPAFRASRSSSLTLTGGFTFDNLLANTEAFDTGGYYDTTTGRFTPLVAGYYRVHVKARLTGFNALEIFLEFNNGATVYHSDRVSASNDSADVDIEFAFDGVDDYVRALCAQGGGGGDVVEGSAQYTWFEAHYVRPL